MIQFTELLDTAHCIAFTGSGGKSSLICTLGKELLSQGKRVVFTTTTHVWPPERSGCFPHAPLLLAYSRGPEELASLVLDSLEDFPALHLGLTQQNGKISGLSPKVLCGLHHLLAADDLYFLVEADGSAGKPLKAQADFEPVIPPCAQLCVAVAGMEGLFQSLNGQFVHRHLLAAQLLEVSPDIPVMPQHIASLLDREHGPFRNCLGQCKIFFNQAEGQKKLQAAQQIAQLLPRYCCYAGSVREGWLQALSA